MKKILISIAVLLIILSGCFMFLNNKNSEKPSVVIAFFGDSITQFGWDNPSGYVHQVLFGLEKAGYKVVPVPAGVCGDTSFDMLERIDDDVLSKSPDTIFFMGGLNNIWHNEGTLDEYKDSINKIYEKAKNSEFILMSLTLISEDIEAPLNKQIDEYNSFLKEFAQEKSILFIDLNSEMKNELKQHKGENILTEDGVHLNDRGNTLVSNKILKDYLNYKK